VIEELEDTHINLMGIHDNEAIFLTQEEKELFLLNQTKVSEEVEDVNNRHSKMPFWRYTGSTICEVKRQKEVPQKR
jgi:L-rhamnose mutarotase